MEIDFQALEILRSSTQFRAQAFMVLVDNAEEQWSRSWNLMVDVEKPRPLTPVKRAGHLIKYHN